MEKYKLTVLAAPSATDVLNQIGIIFDEYGGARPLEINSDEEMLELGNKMLEDTDEDTIILASYTELRMNDKKIGVPPDKEEAKTILKQLSGKTHYFVTKLCIGGAGEPPEVVNVKTGVSLKNFDKWEIDGYLSIWDYNYPGGYSPFGQGALFVRSISGDFNTIKGMPVSTLMELLERKYGITPVNDKKIWKKGSNI